MTRVQIQPMRFALAAAVAVAAFLSAEPAAIMGTGSVVSTAAARVGRPATPMSYAGVARRTTRRTVAAGAAATYAYPSTYAAPGCVQVVDAYGQIVVRCP